ncbi:hypothetical protein NKJ59_24100 [Mesorhizobium australicum]
MEDSNGTPYQSRHIHERFRQDGKRICRGKCACDPQLLAAVIRQRPPHSSGGGGRRIHQRGRLREIELAWINSGLSQYARDDPNFQRFCGAEVVVCRGAIIKLLNGNPAFLDQFTKTLQLKIACGFQQAKLRAHLLKSGFNWFVQLNLLLDWSFMDEKYGVLRQVTVRSGKRR